MSNWDKRWLEKAQQFGDWSKDRSTKVGCVIVDAEQRLVSQGYNGFCTGCDDTIDSRHERPAKYLYTEHAERNAIYNAARLGISVKGTTIYTSLFPCVDCTRAIIQSGIKRLVTLQPDFSHHKYGKDWKVSLELLAETGVIVDYLD